MATRVGKPNDGRSRCRWCSADPLYIIYHDREWGVPLKDSQALFELLCLEGAQAGLSWLTILKKREGYRRAFAGFDPTKVAQMGSREIARLCKDPGIVRHRQKIEATISNARAYLTLEKRGIAFAGFIWQHAPAKPRRAGATSVVTTPESVALSRSLKGAGFRFVGPTTCYAFMQACGMVDDHEPGCWRAKRSAPRARG
jgi:DNA-3-methyladenine glycosylase I